jgi:hypothetical protein
VGALFQLSALKRKGEIHHVYDAANRLAAAVDALGQRTGTLSPLPKPLRRYSLKGVQEFPS